MTVNADLNVDAFATKSDFAYTRVRELILSGQLEPGAVIHQAALARRIGISTTPLREALRRLKQQGLVELDAHRDARVSALDATEARDLLEMRRSLDPLAAALAAERRTKAELAEMRAALEGLDALPGKPTWDQLAHHRRFHTAIYRASHNAILIESLDGLWDTADRYRLHGLQVERSEQERAMKAGEHHQLLEAITAGDAEGASQVMFAHIETSLGAKSAWRLAKPHSPGLPTSTAVAQG
ncbi:DNA-binding GntR family transcriptional regulator [Kineococcus radiotolerans]|uniref:DNA-binding GntR family transcriptional regulator n=1 Tax=Kineococcus radiotolerans TaxID=131568 RepID=A0A7W4TQA5_KINRA|nr:GntR family transcriptional regulator [Kineococcus radiotolerans]MBB2903141.1 DNA-binding GntR family transcriptional regulator [Kineococcus radiotolerans]